MKAIDMVGQRFGKLTVLKKAGSDKGGNALWLCQYDNGEKRVIQGASLRRGNNKGKCSFHGLTSTRTYVTWQNMIRRCTDVNHESYCYYGERGVTVCKRWLDFVEFYKDMGKRPKGLTLERIDNNGNYEALNCKWATPKEQANNTRKNIIINYNDQRFTLAEWARQLGINYVTLGHRIRIHNWSIDRAFNQPVRRR